MIWFLVGLAIGILITAFIFVKAGEAFKDEKVKDCKNCKWWILDSLLGGEKMFCVNPSSPNFYKYTTMTDTCNKWEKD